MITLSEINEAYRNGTPEEKNEFIELISPAIIKNRFFEETVSIIVEKVLLTSELRTIQRIASLENVTGLTDYSDFEEEEDHAPTIPEQITVLAEKIENITVTCKPIIEPVIQPEGVADNRAVTIYNEAKKALETGTSFFGTKQVNHILRNLVPEGFRVKECQNIGQAKKEAFARLDKLFPGMFSFKQKAYGRKDVRLVFQS